jgi:hypothetical protein
MHQTEAHLLECDPLAEPSGIQPDDSTRRFTGVTGRHANSLAEDLNVSPTLVQASATSWRI